MPGSTQVEPGPGTPTTTHGHLRDAGSKPRERHTTAPRGQPSKPFAAPRPRCRIVPMRIPRWWTYQLLTGITSLGAPGAGALAQGIIDITPTNSQDARPLGVSSDGRIVAGCCQNQAIPSFLWIAGSTHNIGIVPLNSINCMALSGDGATTTIFSQTVSGAYVSYRLSNGQSEALTNFGTPPLNQHSFAAAASNDGSTIVGYSAGYGFRAIAWRVQATGVSSVFEIDPGLGYYSDAHSISADGTRVAGTVSNGNNFSVCIWNLGGAGSTGRTLLTPSPSTSLTWASDVYISADGSTLTGMVATNGAQRAYRWDAAGGITFLEPAGRQGWPTGISGDGQAIVGSHMFPTTDPAYPSGQMDRAFLWTASTGVVDLNTYLPSIGVDLGGWTLKSATAISADGSTIVGVGFNAAGLGRAWRYSSTLAPASAVSIGLGCPSSGGGNSLAATTLPWVETTFHATATGLPASAFALTLTSTTSIPQGTVPLAAGFPQAGPGCDVLVAPDILGIVVSSTGLAQSDLFLPSAPPLVGVTFYHQMIPIETSLQGDWLSVTATNALQLTAGSL